MAGTTFNRILKFFTRRDRVSSEGMRDAVIRMLTLTEKMEKEVKTAGEIFEKLAADQEAKRALSPIALKEALEALARKQQLNSEMMKIIGEVCRSTPPKKDLTN